MRRLVGASAVSTLAAVAAGCGSSTHTTPPATTAHASTTVPAAKPATTAPASAPGALQAEANSAAAGDIPDNQVFLVFRNGRGGYSIKYPEGWAQHGAANAVV